MTTIIPITSTPAARQRASSPPSDWCIAVESPEPLERIVATHLLQLLTLDGAESADDYEHFTPTVLVCAA